MLLFGAATTEFTFGISPLVQIRTRYILPLVHHLTYDDVTYKRRELVDMWSHGECTLVHLV